MKPVELAYIAGVVDIFGRIYSRPTETKRLPAVEVNTGNFDLLDLLGTWTRTKPFETRRDYRRGGCEEHCPEQHIHVVSRSGRWTVTGAKATILLAGIRPHLRLQGEMADRMIALGMDADWKPQTVAAMADLGWKIPRRR